ncbi:glucosidase, beta, acid 3 (gene/pseudogene) [Xenopus laevis]|uniref:Cytosolic beta-glucosidase n=1 Tax=Xenopus laevis TaxID=8355 RepID=Q66J37_XENLA|nr:glucosidase, beta, acid 3 (gene/pseudogene) [Xenopus laevis]AAH81073.1 MGC82041 protein [Xenopus laevis]
MENYTFPASFAWGAATAAYQIEGGWDADGKGPSVWDTFTHQGGDRVFKNQTGDVACGSYTLWEEDLKCIKQLGLTHYRFSLSWSRLLPDGTTGFINQKGIEYYNKVINSLLENNISPVVTLYHFDMPQAVEDLGGWRSEKTVDIFEKYAQFCYETFGDRVKLWITINEPYIVARFAYEEGILAPAKKHPGYGAYEAGHNMLRAHAKAWHNYNTNFKKQQNGAVSIALCSDWAEPFNPSSAADKEATNRYLAFYLDWFAKPVFIDGDYPVSMKLKISENSKKEGLKTSRLPELTEEEKALIKGTADFFCLNYYTSRKIKHCTVASEDPSFICDLSLEEIKDPDWPQCAPEWLAVVPWGLRKLLKYIKKTFNNPVIYITENGFGQNDPPLLEDTQRWKFFEETLREVSKAINIDGVNVQGYFVWSLMDNFEWIYGNNARFGLFHVDFDQATLPRTPYLSALKYSNVVKRNGLEGQADNYVIKGPITSNKNKIPLKGSQTQI